MVIARLGLGSEVIAWKCAKFGEVIIRLELEMECGDVLLCFDISQFAILTAGYLYNELL